ncbi:MAG TPA: hypothetical protein ENG69_01060 [Candidatus Korarchaeota archaeon]|nr:hypothetical protein [Candidatus Korarchaeota archaeon]
MREPEWVTQALKILSPHARVSVRGRRVVISVRYDPAPELRVRLRSALRRLHAPGNHGGNRELDEKVVSELRTQLKYLLTQLDRLVVRWDVSLPYHAPRELVEDVVAKLLDDLERSSREAEGLNKVVRQVMAYVNEFLRVSGR